MKKFIVAAILSVFAASSAYACDGMKGHAKGEKADQGDSQPSTAKGAAKDGKGATKPDQKS